MKITPKIKKMMMSLPVDRLLQSSSYLQGYLSSPDLGSESDFNEYKSYEFGDEVKRIDWKVYARSEKLYIKKYSSERSREVCLVFDASASMEGQQNYLEVFYFLIYYLYLKNERYGLVLLKEKNSQVYASAGGSRHLKKMEKTLSEMEFSGQSDYFEEFNRLIQKASRNSEFIFFSDFQNPIDKYRKITSTAKKNNVLLYFVSCFNPNILNLFSGDEQIRGNGNWIVDKETQEKVYFSKNLMSEYEQVVFDHYEELKGFFNRLNIRFNELNYRKHSWENFKTLF